MRKKTDFWDFLSVLILALFALFLIAPLFSLLAAGLRGADGWTLEHLRRFFGKRYYYRALLNSLAVSSSVTLLTLLIGVPMAYATTFWAVRGRRALEMLIIVAMMSPPFIGAYSWILLCGRNGWLTAFMLRTFGLQMPTIYGFHGIVLVLTMKLYPFVYIYVSGAMKKLDISLVEAAQNLGMGGARLVTRAVVPLIAPTALSAALSSTLSAALSAVLSAALSATLSTVLSATLSAALAAALADRSEMTDSFTDMEALRARSPPGRIPCR